LSLVRKPNWEGVEKEKKKKKPNRTASLKKKKKRNAGNSVVGKNWKKKGPRRNGPKNLSSVERVSARQSSTEKEKLGRQAAGKANL